MESTLSFLEKQSKEFERFGKRMNSELKSFYQEYKDNNNNIKECECKKKIEEQNLLIDSLRSRIEILEQNFNKLFLNYKIIKIKNNNEKNFDDNNNNNNNKLFDNEKDLNMNSKNFDYSNSIEIQDKSDKSFFNEENKNFLKKDEQIKNFQNVPTYNITMNEIIKKYITKIKSQDLQKEQEQEQEMNLELKQENQERERDENNYIENNCNSSKNDNDDEVKLGSNDQEDNNSLNSFVDSPYSPFQENPETKGITSEQLHYKIQQIITRRKNYYIGLKLKHFRVLKRFFTINDFIQYTKTNYFNSLDDKPKELLNLLINSIFLNEFDQENVILSQNLEEYINRGIIPELPSEYNNYIEYEKSNLFNKLSEIRKERVRKLVILEKRLALNSLNSQSSLNSSNSLKFSNSSNSFSSNYLNSLNSSRTNKNNNIVKKGFLFSNGKTYKLL
jgi:hypothetical protein